MNFANKQFLIGIKVQSQVGVDYSPNLWQALVGFHSRRLRRLAATINMDVNRHIHVIQLSLIEFFAKERSFS